MGKTSKARATREDPSQESLVQRKDELNQRVKEIINLLIETKRSWNGKPAPSIGVNEPHSIKEPLPEETGRAMDKIVSMVEEAERELEQIESQQAGYQNSRRKPREKSEPFVQEEPGKPKEEENLDLSSLASDSVSRFLTHIKAPFQWGDSNKWERLKLLRAASNIESHLEEIDELVLTKDDLSIPKAIYKAKDLFYIFENQLVEPVKIAVRALPEKPDLTPEPEPEVQETYQEFTQPYGGAANIYQELDGLESKLSDVRRSLKDQVDVRGFNSLMSEIRTAKESVTSGNDIDISELKNSVQQFISDAYSAATLEANANRFSRWMKRKNIEYLTPSSDHKKSTRLRVDSSIKKIRSSLDKVMDSLESKNIHVASVAPYVSKLASDMKELYSSLYVLGDIHNSEVRVKKHKAKSDGEKTKSDIVNSTDLNVLRKFVEKLSGIVSNFESLEGLHG